MLYRTFLFDAKTSPRPDDPVLRTCRVHIDTVPSCSKNELEPLVLCSYNNNQSHFIHTCAEAGRCTDTYVENSKGPDIGARCSTLMRRNLIGDNGF